MDSGYFTQVHFVGFVDFANFATVCVVICRSLILVEFCLTVRD